MRLAAPTSQWVVSPASPKFAGTNGRTLGLLNIPQTYTYPPGSVNEYLLQLGMGRQRQVFLIPLADETQGVQVKLYYPLTTRATPERLRDA